jgi:hypothetical protein
VSYRQLLLPEGQSRESIREQGIGHRRTSRRSGISRRWHDRPIRALTAPNAEVLTVEYKINFLSPARGELLVARGRVTKPGRTLTVCTADVFAVSTGQEKLVATMLATIMAVGVPRDVAQIPPGTTERISHQLVRSRRWCPCRGLRGVRHKVSHMITHRRYLRPVVEGLAVNRREARASAARLIH